MSQDQLPPDSNSEPQAPPPDSPTPAQESSPTPQQRLNQAQTQLKTRTIQVLRVTIRTLEGIVTRLEAEPPPTQTPRKLLPPALETTIAQVNPTVQSLWERVTSSWQRVQAWWTPTLNRIRGYLPASLNQQLSDRALTGAIAGLLVIVLWTTTGLLSSRPKPTAIAKAPPATQVPPAATPSPTVQPTVPPTLSTPEPQKPVVVTPPPVQKPAPPLKLTPEQKLIAAIQDQVAEISNQYVNGLILSVQANFRSSRLTVKVGEGWYGLSRSQQDKLAGEILRRAQNLDFSKLELTDLEGTLLARSPVVGTEMVILKRKLEPQTMA